jgi:hypothetical protein
MRIRPVIYILLFFTIWTQVDNFVLAPFLPSPAGWVALDDDEYVPAKREQSRVRPSSRHAPEFTAGKRAAARFFPGCRESRSQICLKVLAPVGPPLLYALMSLQC